MVDNSQAGVRASGSLLAAEKARVRKEFARRLHAAMMAKGWRQRDLVTKTGLTRDNISNYARGTKLPSEDKLLILLKALGLKREDLLPGSDEFAMQRRKVDTQPAVVRIDLDESDSSVCHLHIIKTVPTKIGLKIMEILNSEAAD